MSDNATFDVVDVGLQDPNTTITNGTASALVSPQNMDFFLLEIKLVLSALGIIYLGSHAALRRPPSAAPTRSKKAGQKEASDDLDDNFQQGLLPSDAIMFPVLAGVMLVGLYYLIQWLKDPAILNTILQWYMSIMSIASLVTMYAHGIDLGTSFIFPLYFRGRDGALRVVNQKTRAVAVRDGGGNPLEGRASTSNPLPGPLALLAFSERSQKTVWKIRGVLTQRLTAKVYARGMGEEKGLIKVAHLLAVVLSLVTAIVYFATKSTFLSNMLGYGMCYGSFLILSPTDFLTGSLVLWGLFIYDVVMVFYTPFMVTVATTLEVPIKLTFEAASRKSILGLGDIVIPGMVIAWALRFDLWLHYLRKVKYDAVDLSILEKDASGVVVTRQDSKHKEVKARYVNVKGTWGNLLWTRGFMFISGSGDLPASLSATRFSKVYFYAAMAGYGAGMLVTLAMLMVYKRGQPALLYLVPGVLVSLSGTALVRGEFKELWRYTEDGSIDTMDVVVELDGSGKAIKTIGKLENGVVDMTKAKEDDKDKKDAKDETKGDGKDKGGAPKEKGNSDKQTEGGTDPEEVKKRRSVFSLSVDLESEDEEE